MSGMAMECVPEIAIIGGESESFGESALDF
jgi:hypothetical protein